MPDAPKEMLVPVGAVKAVQWFLENSLDTFLAVHGETLVHANPTWTRVTGHATETTHGQPFLSFVHPDDRDAVSDALERLSPDERGVIEHRLSTAAGDWLWMRSHAQRAEDGWTVMILRDITDDRRRELEADQARHAARMLRITAGVTTWRYDPDLDRYEINPDFSKPAGASNPERRVAGEGVRTTVHRADAPMLHLAWTQALRSGEANVVEYRERGADGIWRRMRVAWQGVRPLPSGKWEMLGIAQDVTDLTEARDAAMRGEKAARAAAEAKSEFLANMSHEIRTPMNGVLGILHLIKTDPGAADRQGLVDQALASGAALADLLASIIDYSDIESGRMALVSEPVEPAAQLASVIDIFRPRAAAKGIALDVAYEPDMGAVSADPARLRQIFFNLIGNAVKFTEMGRIDVRLSGRGEREAYRLKIEVKDTGIGIAPAAQAGLFERFSQGDGSSTRRFGGSGLGLAITRRLAELMGGGVGLSSQEGVGSTFWAEVAAPACAEAEPEPELDESDLWLSGLRVLVVEDNPTNRLVATHMLGQLGADVETAVDGAEGVAAVERSHFDLIFMDIQMPVMDGIEATRRIRAMPAPRGLVPIVATTANVMPQQLATYQGCGISGVVAKPISPSALVAEVARLAAEGEAANDADAEARVG